MCVSPPFVILSNATTQKRGCNTATCVTHRLADFLSRSGGLGHSNFVPTNVGAQAFGRRKRHSPVWAKDEVHTHRCYKVWSISCNSFMFCCIKILTVLCSLLFFFFFPPFCSRTNPHLGETKRYHRKESRKQSVSSQTLTDLLFLDGCQRVAIIYCSYVLQTVK